MILKKIIKIGYGTYNIDVSQTFQTGNYLVGTITLRLKGKFHVFNSEYHFQGILKAFDDYYDFNASNHRSRIAEFATTIGRLLNGIPYEIQIRGEKEINI